MHGSRKHVASDAVTVRANTNNRNILRIPYDESREKTPVATVVGWLKEVST
jgi:hypothetical protein